jgi:hypothetical protein
MQYATDQINSGGIQSEFSTQQYTYGKTADGDQWALAPRYTLAISLLQR